MSNFQNLQDLNKASQQEILHYDPIRINYTISPEELTSIENVGGVIWKDIFFCSIGVFAPTIISSIVELGSCTSDKGHVSSSQSFIWNMIFASLSLGMAIISGLAWRQSKNKLEDIIKHIKQKTPHKINNTKK